MAELKPCPFCGGEAYFVCTHKGDKTHWKADDIGFVKCENDCIEQCLVLTMNEAIEAWNRRAEDGKTENR